MLYQNYAGGAFLGMSALALLGFIAALVLARLWNGGHVVSISRQA